MNFKLRWQSYRFSLYNFSTCRRSSVGESIALIKLRSEVRILPSTQQKSEASFGVSTASEACVGGFESSHTHTYTYLVFCCKHAILSLHGRCADDFCFGVYIPDWRRVWVLCGDDFLMPRRLWRRGILPSQSPFIDIRPGICPNFLSTVNQGKRKGRFRKTGRNCAGIGAGRAMEREICVLHICDKIAVTHALLCACAVPSSAFWELHADARRMVLSATPSSLFDISHIVMLQEIKKRNGDIAPFYREKIPTAMKRRLRPRVW